MKTNDHCKEPPRVIAGSPKSVITKRQHQRPVSLRGGTTKQSQLAAAPTPDCFTTVRNDTPRPTPLPSNRVIARRHDEAISASVGTNPRLLHSVRNDTPRPRRRSRNVSLRGGNDEAISSQWRHQPNSITPKQIPRVHLLFNITQFIGHTVSQHHIAQVFESSQIINHR